MSVTERILNYQITHGIFDGEEHMVRGIAQRAVDNGFASLSSSQQSVIEPFLTQSCSGVTDPGGYHNECEKILMGEELLEAYELCDDSESLECESCRSDSSFYTHQRDRLERE
ncbi:hypothetical protein V5030_02130 [Moellerella wisconsensis]|uniref:hypothetical protein n=1 Tax=Moellerella wisconsensis TaxID=158849 RepID=UPI0030762DA9